MGTRISSRRRPRYVETDDYGRMVRRIVTAYRRRVAAGPGDIESLAALAGLAGDVDDAITAAVIALHDAGYSWQDLGRVLGTTRQAVQQRYGRRPAG